MPNSLVCIDASFVMRLLQSDGSESPAVRLWIAWHEANRALVAPTLLYYEVVNALHRYVMYGELLPGEAIEALHACLALDVTLYGDAALHRHALELAGRFSLPAAYDAHYLALAERFGARMYHTVKEKLPWVKLLSSDREG